MKRSMRCQYCGLLQDEPVGVKECQRCGGELAFETVLPSKNPASFLEVQMELDQVQAPAGNHVDRYLLITLRTPKEIPEAQAIQNMAYRPPIHFTTVLDVSGSMTGTKISQAKEALRQSLQYLRDGDWISLVTFSNSVSSLLPPIEISKKVINQVESIIKEIQAGGMTALCGGLEIGIQQSCKRKLPNNLVLLLSDGQANVGETDLEKIGAYSYKARKEGLVVSGLGIGADYNEGLLVEIANQGGGRFYHLADANQIPSFLTGELGEAANFAAKQVVIRIETPPGTTIFPLSSAYPATQIDNGIQVSVGDIPKDIELEIPLRLSCLSQTEGTRLSFQGSILYHSPIGNTFESPLNRVTIRFVASSAFSQRAGIALPIAEKVMDHLRASYVVGLARNLSKNAEEAEEFSLREARNLRNYAALISPEQASKMEAELSGKMNLRASSPAHAKKVVSESLAFMRKIRNFDD